MNRNYNPLRMCLGKDGNMSLTRTAACCAHFLFFVTVAGITWITKTFNEAMWAMYIGVAVVHAAYDKTAAQVKDFKEKKLELPQQPASTPE
jgi:hypothetical protein